MSARDEKDGLWLKRADRLGAGKFHSSAGYQEMFQGTIDGASVHPREVVKEALKQNAAAESLAAS